MGRGLQAPRGTRDLFGEELERLESLERLCAGTARLWGYSGIRTPAFEHTGLFKRSIGEATDIVEKEMFTIPRRTEKEGQDSFTLRPENTAGVVRAYLEHNLHKTQGLTKFHYVGPQFRRERPQKGRFREFNQMGVEVLGLQKGASPDKGSPPLAYVEVMLLAAEILAKAGLKDLRLRYNSVGCKAEGCRDAYRASLKDELAAQKDGLCGDCQRRLDRNVFRVLDCKKPNCREICTAALVALPQEFCIDCRSQLAFAKEELPTLLPEGVKADHDRFLVRGLDYYTGTVFEFVALGLGAQDAVGGGGSYDGLIEEFGGPPLGATGFALGLERILLAQQNADASKIKIPAVGPLVYVAPQLPKSVDPPSFYGYGSEAKLQLARYGYQIATQLRRQGLTVAFDLFKHGRKLGNSLSRAVKLGARLAVIIGEEEVKAEEVALKDMETGEQRKVKQDALAEEIRKVLGS